MFLLCLFYVCFETVEHDIFVEACKNDNIAHTCYLATSCPTQIAIRYTVYNQRSLLPQSVMRGEVGEITSCVIILINPSISARARFIMIYKVE